MGTLKKTYTVVHVDRDQSVETWFPDFPGLTVPGDRLADTIFLAPLVLQQHIGRLGRDGLPVPEPTTPDIWSIYDRHPGALVGFTEVEIVHTGEEVAGDEALDDGIGRDARQSR